MVSALNANPLDEFALIDRYFKRLVESSHVTLGIGDDCALVDVPHGHQLAFSIDTLLADVHFFAKANPTYIAHRALSVALSDLAAMGAEPLCFTLALSLPEADEKWLASFSEGLLDCAKRYSCPLVGGDTVRGPLCISIQVHGIVPSGQAMVRSGAKTGDGIYVTGSLGDGAAALSALKGSFSVNYSAAQYLRQRYYQPIPQLELGQKLRGIASAAIDVSDGLVADLGHICRASGNSGELGAELDLQALPISDAVCQHTQAEQWLEWALYGGDDYQLCFTVSQSKIASLDRLIADENFAISRIGEITRQQGIRCSESEKLLSKSNTGYKHF